MKGIHIQIEDELRSRGDGEKKPKFDVRRRVGQKNPPIPPAAGRGS
jgi:hypothetical protein